MINAYASAVHWQIDDRTLTAVSDGYFETDLPVVFPDFDVPEADRLQRAALRPTRPRITHNVYVVRSSDQAPVLIDAGMGGGWGPTMGYLPEALVGIGVPPEDVGAVLLTHLHLDHSAGLVDADGRARFPNAEVIVHAEEADYWLDSAPATVASDEPPWSDGVTRLGVQRALAPYRDRIRTFDSTAHVLAGIQAVPLTGHTPGHSGYLVGSGERAVLAVGDLVHLPAVQAPRPDASVVFDIDPRAAAATRAAVLDEVARSGRLVAGGHTEFPGVARVERVGDAYRVVPDLWVASLP